MTAAIWRCARASPTLSVFDLQARRRAARPRRRARCERRGDQPALSGRTRSGPPATAVVAHRWRRGRCRSGGGCRSERDPVRPAGPAPGDAGSGRSRLPARCVCSRLPGAQETGRIPVERRGEFALARAVRCSRWPADRAPPIARPGSRNIDLFDVASARSSLRLAEGSRPEVAAVQRRRRAPVQPRRRCGRCRTASCASGACAAACSRRGCAMKTRSRNVRVKRARRPAGHAQRPADPHLGGAERRTAESDRCRTPASRTNSSRTDGSRLLTGSIDGRTVLWLWRSDDLRAQACRRLTRNLDRDEWTRYLGAEPYRATCPALPANAPAAPAFAASAAPSSPR